MEAKGAGKNVFDLVVLVKQAYENDPGGKLTDGTDGPIRTGAGPGAMTAAREKRDEFAHTGTAQPETAGTAGDAAKVASFTGTANSINAWIQEHLEKWKPNGATDDLKAAVARL